MNKIIILLLITINLHGLEFYNINTESKDTSIDVEWNTSYITKCKFIFYGKAVQTTKGYRHKITISDLKACTIYYYHIHAVDEKANELMLKGWVSTMCTKGISKGKDI